MNVVRFWMAAFYSVYIALITVMLFLVFISVFSPSITPIETFRIAHHAYLESERIVSLLLVILVIEWVEKAFVAFPKFHTFAERILPCKYRLGTFLFGVSFGLSMILTLIFTYST